MNLLGNPNEPAVEERPANFLAGSGERGDLQKYGPAHSEPDPWHHGLPANALESEVFAQAADLSGMAFGLKGMDLFQGVYAHGAIRSAVVYLVVLVVAFKP
jgi:hypothetical protein